MRTNNRPRRGKKEQVARLPQRWIWRPAIFTFVFLLAFMLIARPLLQSDRFGGDDVAFAFLFAIVITGYQIYRARKADA